MEFKGTKRAEWECNHNGAELFGIMPITEVYIKSTEDELGEWIAQVRGDSEQERKANAQLIANAPKMLEMLNRIFIEKCNGVNNIHYSEIEKIINQATKID